MNLFTMFLILALLVAIWWLVRKRREAVAEDQSSQVREKSKNTQFHAVSIKYTGRACESAKDLSGRRFLATAAPKLPLPDCDVLDCSCRFVHHQDRRAQKERRSPFGPGGVGSGTGAFDAENREGKERRGYDD
jgi:hypothetical protein